MRQQGFEFDDAMSRGAGMSSCHKYRYSLWRIWEARGPCVAFIGLNPSTADEVIDDPTIRKCIGFARRWGFGGLFMLNLFPLRATLPRDMKAAVDPLGGPAADSVLLHYADQCQRLVACWGVDGAYRGRGDQVVNLLQAAGRELHCLGVTKDGQPKHPLYIPYDTKLELYRG